MELTHLLDILLNEYLCIECFFWKFKNVNNHLVLFLHNFLRQIPSKFAFYKVYYMKVRDDSSQIWTMINHVIICFLWFYLCIIFFSICINCFFLFGLCRLTSHEIMICELFLVSSFNSHTFFWVQVKECALNLHFNKTRN